MTKMTSHYDRMRIAVGKVLRGRRGKLPQRRGAELLRRHRTKLTRAENGTGPMDVAEFWLLMFGYSDNTEGIDAASLASIPVEISEAFQQELQKDNI